MINLIPIIYLIQSNSVVLFSYIMPKPAQANGIIPEHFTLKH
jgi:hypothetical protein